MWFPYAAPFYIARIGIAISQPVVDRPKTLRARFHFNTQCAATDYGVEIVTAFDTFARSCAPPIFMAIRLGREATSCDPEELLPRSTRNPEGAENRTNSAGRPPGSRSLWRRIFLARN